MIAPRYRPLALPILAACLLCGGPAGTVRSAHADGSSRLNLLDENDSLYFHSDKHYTQGVRIAYLAPSVAAASAWNGPFDWLGPLFAGPASERRYSTFFGQSIFTPKNLTLRPPDPRDRPYGGWLFAGSSLLQKTESGMLENFEIELGVIGPAAFGKEVQNDWHQLIGISQARGWSDQIQNEPGTVISYERLWRVSAFTSPWSDVDIVPQLGGSVGNVFTYGEGGATLRLGKGLAADYGPARVRPALSGTDYFDADAAPPGLRGYLYASAGARVVGINAFLDGNSFRTSPNVPKKRFVGDLQAGAALFWSSVKLDFSVAKRTEEFRGQHTPDVIGTAALAFSW